MPAALATVDDDTEWLRRPGDDRGASRGAGVSRPWRSTPKHKESRDLLNAAATARFAPARIAGAPVAFNVVWLVAHTTVRAPFRASCTCPGGRLEDALTRRRGVAPAWRNCSWSRSPDHEPAGRGVTLQRQFELLDANRRSHPADTTPASAAHRASTPPSRWRTIRRAPRTGSSCGRLSARGRDRDFRRRVVDVERRCSRARLRAPLRHVRRLVRCNDFDHVRAIGHRRRIPHENRIGDVRFQRLPRGVAFAAIHDLVAQLVVVRIFGPPDKRLQPALINARRPSRGEDRPGASRCASASGDRAPDRRSPRCPGRPSGMASETLCPRDERSDSSLWAAGCAAGTRRIRTSEPGWPVCRPSPPSIEDSAHWDS